MLCAEIIPGERTRPRVLAMAARHREIFLNVVIRRIDQTGSVSVRAPKRAREGACAPQNEMPLLTYAFSSFVSHSRVCRTLRADSPKLRSQWRRVFD
jgi:hypothetical protein